MELETYYQYINIEAWGRGFEKIKEACGLYDGPLPEYDINEAGIMVLCKACDRYLELLRDASHYLGQGDHDNDQDVMGQIIEFCKEPTDKGALFCSEYYDIDTGNAIYFACSEYTSDSDFMEPIDYGPGRISVGIKTK